MKHTHERVLAPRQISRNCPKMSLLIKTCTNLRPQLSRGFADIASTRNKPRVQIHKKIVQPVLDTSRRLDKEESNETDVVLSKNGDVVVCWHPEKPFPYEMTKPLPAEAVMTDSTLKIQALHPVKEIFRKKNDKLVVTELTQITYTSKHRWYQKPKRATRYSALNPKDEKRDRDFL